MAPNTDLTQRTAGAAGESSPAPAADGAGGPGRVRRRRLSVVRAIFLSGILGWPATAAGGGAPALKPLPKNRHSDQYESRADFLRSAAAFETRRLRGGRFGHAAEAARFRGADFRVTVAPGVDLKFLKIPAGHYVDGLTPELMDCL